MSDSTGPITPQLAHRVCAHQRILSLTACALAAITALVFACSPAPPELSFSGVPTTAAAGETIVVTVKLRGISEAATVSVEATKGGGSVDAKQLSFTTEGSRQVVWTLGLAPVPQELRVGVATRPGGMEQAVARVTVHATRDTPLAPEAFGTVDADLTAAKLDGSTEDLAFTPDGTGITLGVVGGLIRVDKAGKSSVITTTGDAISQALGVAYDAEGRLWICDSKGKALRRMSADLGKGQAPKIETILAKDSGKELGSPNYLAVLPNGDVVFSDPCLARLFWVDGATGAVKARHDFDPKTEGGPNGIALSPDGSALYVTTENTALLCNQGTLLPLEKPVAGLFKIEINDTGFGTRSTVQANIGLFGDGLAFDAEGNLYVTIDRSENLAFKESTLEVLPAGGDKLEPFLRSTDHIFANVAFGTSAFGAETIYISTLALPPFTKADTRGLLRIKVGIAGAPLGPQRAE